ncbi:MAG: TonB-dependent outer rane cobalamin receptor [Pseudomonadota bacterium]|jgi:iron complex outermembrane receptor protein
MSVFSTPSGNLPACAVVRTSFSLVAMACAASLSPAVLAQSSADLSQVVITGTRFSEDATRLPFGVSVLTAKDLKDSGVTTVNEALMKLLGVPGRQDAYGGGDYGLDLRGFGTTADSNQVVVVDGIRVSEADTGGTRLAGIPIDSVERIEVIRGSGAVLYGEGASAGVIVITTKAGRGTARVNGAQVYAGVGSHATREGRASATLAAGDFSLDVAANKRRSDNHRDNFKSDVEGASVTGQWATDWLRIGARHAYDDLHTGLPGALTAAQYDADPSQTTTPLAHASIRNHRSSVFSEATLGDWQLAFDAGWRDKALSSTSNSGSIYAYDIDANTQALRARNSSHLAGLPNTLVLGVDRGEWNRQVKGGGLSVQTTRAGYLKDEIALDGGTRLSAGWRAEHVEKSNTDTAQVIAQTEHAWELGAVQALQAGWAMFGRVGESFRLPNVDEFGYTSPGVSLRTQTSRDTELGLRWNASATRAELRFYRSALTHEIGFDPNAFGPFDGATPTGANANFDPTRRQGVEAEVNQAVGPDVSLRVVAAARQARFVAGQYDGKRVPLTPSKTLSVRTDWTPQQHHRVGAVLSVVSSQVADFDNSCRMPGYATLDLRYAYQIGKAELAASVANLADRKYYTQAFGCSGGVTTFIYPEAGRVFSTSARLSF